MSILTFPIRFLYALLTVGYYNPALLISLAGLVYYRSWQWLAAFLISWAFLHAASILATNSSSLRNLEEAVTDFLNEQSMCRLEELDSTPFFESGDFYHILTSRAVIQKLMPSTLPDFEEMHWRMKAHPLRVFIARREGGGIAGAVKAYVNCTGPSLVFLSRHPRLLDPNQLFLLMHELEHVSARGAFQLSHLFASRYYWVFNTLLLCFIASSCFQWLGAVLYFLEASVWLFFFMPMLREVAADNGALHKLSNSHDQEQVINDLTEMWRDQLDNEVSLWNGSMLRERIRAASLFKSALEKHRRPPSLNWATTASPLHPVVFGLFFAYLGISCPEPPWLPLLAILLFVIWAFRTNSKMLARAWRANQTINTFVEQHLVQSDSSHSQADYRPSGVPLVPPTLGDRGRAEPGAEADGGA